MAQNLFEKYGIKEVADVTLFRIERKDETYESQRKISISSILKGALTKQMVYPLDEDGKGSIDGYEAYVFKDADVLTHFNYDCDDEINLKGSVIFVDVPDEGGNSIADEQSLEYGQIITKEEPEGIYEAIEAALKKFDDDNGDGIIDILDPLSGNVVIKNVINVDTGINLGNKVYSLVTSGYSVEQNTLEFGSTIKYLGKTTNTVTADEAGLYEYRANIVPSSYAISIPKEMKDNLPETIKVDEEGLTGNRVKVSGYLTIGAPYNATGDMLRAAFIAQQKALYEALGIIVRFEQIVRTDNMYNPDAADTEEEEEDEDEDDGDEDEGKNKTKTYDKYLVTFSVKLIADSDKKTGMVDFDETTGHYEMDPDAVGAGTHEFTYPQQICMLFAKNQNLITKAGTRYFFDNANELFGNYEFNDQFASIPNGTERVVVVGLDGKVTENLYDFDEINEAIKSMTDTLDAKAYTITYSDYAELIVEDEMGYYIPKQLGSSYDRSAGTVSFFDKKNSTYAAYAKKGRGVDMGIYSAVDTWGDAVHFSINDAIDALKMKKKMLDNADATKTVGFERVFGGYRVRGQSLQSELPVDDDGRGAMYENYTIDGVTVNDISGKQLSSSYTLQGVLEALATANIEEFGKQLRITSTVEAESNRAIYVDAAGGALANSAYIYLLKNVKKHMLSADTDGIFEFYDKKGNRLFYQDKVFAGTEFLALVVIGSKGLVFVVDRHGNKSFDQTAWMINDGGYITDKQTARIVKNGLIHTVSVTVCDESFDATCTVAGIKVRKTKKNVLRYIPVLYLDTLKVSTIEQATETTSATGGHGNSKLMTWDYGKEITLSIEDALYTPASMAAVWAGEDGDLKNGVKEAKWIDRFEKITAKKNFIIPAGNQAGPPTEGDVSARAVYYDPKTMEPFQDGTPIAINEVIYKLTRSVAYRNESIGTKIEISAEKFPGTYRVVGETCVKDKATGQDQRFQFVIPEAKMSASNAALTLESDGDPVVFDFSMDVLRPENGVMMEFYQFDVVENTEENDGSTMVKNTENLNLLDDAEMYRVSSDIEEDLVIGATEY